MKTKSLIILAVILSSTAAFTQNLIRVNNLEAADADYLTLQEAHDNAQDGDIIYLEGSATEYSGADISKKLTIIGAGHSFWNNPNTPANNLESKINSAVNFNDGSEGASLLGCYMSTASSYMYINVDSITISRCNTYHIHFEDTVSNILILQNLVWGEIKTNSKGVVKNSIISNNFVHEGIGFNASCENLQIVHNIMNDYYHGFSLSCHNAIITNNIICEPDLTIQTNAGNTITNNLFAGDGTDADGNKYNIDMTTVFVYYGDWSDEHSYDGKWQLKTGSPAIGAGSGGLDCGMFGGTTPYVIAGIPPLPYIYEATIPATANAGESLTVTIKVRSGK